MSKFEVRLTPAAQADIRRVIDFIAHTYHAPLTAERYLIGLYDEIFALSNYADSIQISTRLSVLKYGANARSISYKKLTIIYTVHQRIALVQAVVSSALVISE